MITVEYFQSLKETGERQLSTFFPEEDTLTPLQLGIISHESGNLSLAACYFYLSLKQGNPMGCYLFSISLRHGWGCQKNENAAIFYLRKSIEIIISMLSIITPQLPASNFDITSENDANLKFTISGKDLLMIIEGKDALFEKNKLVTHLSPLVQRVMDNDNVSVGPKDISQDIQIAKNLLPLPLFELAMCFHQGWGTTVNLKKARHLYRFAAKLGDLESQVQLANLYIQGGFHFKKAKARAAYWLREANKNGRKGVNETWINKPKYTDLPASKNDQIVSGDENTDAPLIIEILTKYRTGDFNADKTKFWFLKSKNCA